MISVSADNRGGILPPFGNEYLPGVIAAVSSRSHGTMSLTCGASCGRSALENREAFLIAAGMDPAALVCARQAHGSRVVRVEQSARGRGARDDETAYPDTDAFVTDVPGLPVAVFTADCLSVFLYDPRRRAVALVHAGRRGTAAGITALALRALKSAYGCEPRDVRAAFGPCIRQCCYEVGRECAGGLETDACSRDGRLFLDIAGANRRQLISGGVAQDSIADCRICTACVSSAEDFFSYRREGAAAGRMMSVIMLNGGA